MAAVKSANIGNARRKVAAKGSRGASNKVDDSYAGY